MVLLVPEEKPQPSWGQRWESFCCWANREPQLTVRRVVWIVTVGWALALFYGAAAIFMAFSLVFIPFVLPALQLAWFVLDPVCKEAVPHNRFNRTFTTAANLVWLFLFGWELTMLLAAAAVVQCITVIGIPTAMTLTEFMKFTLWPFGKDIQPRHLPTHPTDLRAMKSGVPPGVLPANVQMEPPRAGSLASKGAPMGEYAV